MPGLGVRALTLGSRGGGMWAGLSACEHNRALVGGWERTQLVGTPGKACRSDVLSSLGKRFRGLAP